MQRAQRPLVWPAIAALAACLALGAWGVLAREPVPLLTLVNLGFHELGHLLTYPFPDLFTAVMGSVTQIAVPAGLAAYFAWRRHDALAAAVCLAWAATSAEEAAVYIADAPFERLELIGGEHDWAFVLHRLNAVEAADELALAVRVLAWGLLALAIGLCVRRLLARPAPERGPLPGVTVRPISWEDPAP